MRPVYQDRFGTKGKHTGNCFAACIASIFEVPLDEVPHCEDWPEQWSRLCKWLAGRGFAILDVRAGFSNLGFHVRCGPTPRGLRHAVVYSGDELVHDPFPDGAGILETDGGFTFAPIDPAEISRLRARLEKAEAYIEADDLYRLGAPEGEPKLLEQLLKNRAAARRAWEES